MRRFILPVLVLAAALAGCGDGDTSTESGTGAVDGSGNDVDVFAESADAADDLGLPSCEQVGAIAEAGVGASHTLVDGTAVPAASGEHTIRACHYETASGSLNVSISSAAYDPNDFLVDDDDPSTGFYTRSFASCDGFDVFATIGTPNAAEGPSVADQTAAALASC